MVGPPRYPKAAPFRGRYAILLVLPYLMNRYRRASELRIRTIPVGARRAVLHVEHQQHDPPDDRDERDEDPPARTIDIVEPPDRYGDTRDQDREAEDATQQPHPCPDVVGAGKAIDYVERDAYEDGEQDEVPVLLAPRAPAKDGVLPQRLGEPLHLRSPPPVGRYYVDNVIPVRLFRTYPGFRRSARVRGHAFHAPGCRGCAFSEGLHSPPPMPTGEQTWAG